MPFALKFWLIFSTIVIVTVITVGFWPRGVAQERQQPLVNTPPGAVVQKLDANHVYYELNVGGRTRKFLITNPGGVRWQTIELHD